MDVSIALIQNEEVIVSQDVNVLLLYSVWIAFELDKRY
jgi:hypothetical protein